MFKAIKQRLAVKPLSDSIDELETWFTGPLGQTILADEQIQIDNAVADLYGFHLLQMSVNRDIDLSRNSTIQHRFSIAPSQKSQGETISALAEGERIPLESESVDVVMLHHT